MGLGGGKMDSQKVKKINVPYLLGYIFAPAVVCALCYWLSYMFFPKGIMAVILIMGSSLLAILWWSLGGKLLYRQKNKAMEKELDASGFSRNNTFNGRGCTVIVDGVHGNVALLFFWNPFQHFVFPASRVSRAWVDDGCHGSGFMKGSSNVSFLFTVDDVKIRVYTFTSNKRWRMDSDYILTGISKADMMVNVLNDAKGQAG